MTAKLGIPEIICLAVLVVVLASVSYAPGRGHRQMLEGVRWYHFLGVALVVALVAGLGAAMRYPGFGR